PCASPRGRVQPIRKRATHDVIVHDETVTDGFDIFPSDDESELFVDVDRLAVVAVDPELHRFGVQVFGLTKYVIHHHAANSQTPEIPLEIELVEPDDGRIFGIRRCTAVADVS